MLSKSLSLATAFFALAVVLVAAPSAQATTVTDFSVEDLVRLSHLAVRAEVTETTAVDAERVRYSLKIDELLFGELPSGTLDLELMTGIHGMPRLGAGDDVILFLNLNNRIEKILGLQWGTFRVRGESIHDYDGRRVELRSEMRGQRARDFLRPVGQRSRGLAYGDLKRVVGDTRTRIAAGGTSSTGAGPAELDRK